MDHPDLVAFLHGIEFLLHFGFIYVHFGQEPGFFNAAVVVNKGSEDPGFDGGCLAGIPWG